MSERLFSLRIGRDVAFGLDRAPSTNALIARCVPAKPLKELVVHECTTAKAGNDIFTIIRVQ